MDTKLCSTCNIEPEMQTDELGMTYRFICRKCGKCTQDLLSPSATLTNPYCDCETLQRLTEEWNDINEMK